VQERGERDATEKGGRGRKGKAGKTEWALGMAQREGQEGYQQGWLRRRRLGTKVGWCTGVSR